MARVVPIVVLLLVAAGCGGDAPPPPRAGPAPSRGAAELTITTDRGRVELAVEVADEPDERRVGLMHRERLDPLDGMAFLWPEPVHTSFWMKDTLIPLSIAFWDENGRIVAILDMEPCRADPCPTYDPQREFLGAVEVEQGLFDQRGVRVGDLVDLEAGG